MTDALPLAPYDARVAANFIVYLHLSKSEPITQLRLYKLLYFAHGWHLAERAQQLVWNAFEAWEHGPVIKVVRDCFCRFGEDDIDSFASMFDLRAGDVVELPHRLQASDEAFVAQVVSAYSDYSAKQLSLITHAKGSPWEQVWRAGKPVGRFGLRLTDHEILRDFQDMVDLGEFDYKQVPPSLEG